VVGIVVGFKVDASTVMLENTPRCALHCWSIAEHRHNNPSTNLPPLPKRQK